MASMARQRSEVFKHWAILGDDGNGISYARDITQIFKVCRAANESWRFLTHQSNQPPWWHTRTFTRPPWTRARAYWNIFRRRCIESMLKRSLSRGSQAATRFAILKAHKTVFSHAMCAGMALQGAYIQDTPLELSVVTNLLKFGSPSHPRNWSMLGWWHMCLRKIGAVSTYPAGEGESRFLIHGDKLQYGTNLGCSKEGCRLSLISVIGIRWKLINSIDRWSDFVYQFIKTLGFQPALI